MSPKLCADNTACVWFGRTELYERVHDAEAGVPERDDCEGGEPGQLSGDHGQCGALLPRLRKGSSKNIFTKILCNCLRFFRKNIFFCDSFKLNSEKFYLT